MPVNPTDVEFVRAMVHQRSAIALDASKDYLIETRLERAALEKGLSGIAELVSRARSGEPLMTTTIVEAITTHETFFFRDVAPFEVLKTEVLGPLVAARASSRTLTIWSAACSAGQEAFSIAMLLLEQFPQVADWKVQIVGTDLSQPIVNRAREARYNQIEVSRGLPASYLVKYFDRVGASWVVKDRVRRMVTFSQANLTDPWLLPTPPDVVFMRNVLIYFDQATKRALLDRLRLMLPRDGALFLGAAETTINVADGWQRLGDGTGSFYRVRP